jgi:hypothetical protein
MSEVIPFARHALKRAGHFASPQSTGFVLVCVETGAFLAGPFATKKLVCEFWAKKPKSWRVERWVFREVVREAQR